MKKKIIILIVFFVTFSKAALSLAESDTIFVAFWNLENLFDTIDDPSKEDEEFLPTSQRGWTQERYEKKMYNLARVFNSMNNGNAPDIIGIAECENQAALELFVSKYLKEKNYKIAYAESPDNRGIDCGFIYRSDKFELLSSKGHEITKLRDSPTRLILQAKLKASNGEQVDFFVNHWPSRRDGAIESEYKRNAAADVLRREVNNLFKKKSQAKIIMMGDFNDDPVDESVLKSLGTQQFKCEQSNEGNVQIPEKELYNLSYNLFEKGLGTLTYKGNWNLFDQIIISSSVATQKGLSYVCDSFSIFNNEMVATRSGKYKGNPFPTYAGPRYLGGYSDHFPVTAKFVIR